MGQCLMPAGRCNFTYALSRKTGADTEIYPELTKGEEAGPKGLDSHNTPGLTTNRKGLRPPEPPVGSRLSRVHHGKDVRHHALRALTSFLGGSGAGIVLGWFPRAGRD